MKFHRSTAETARTLRFRGVPETEILAQFQHKFTSDEITWQIEELRRQHRIYSKTYYSQVTWKDDEKPVRPDPLAMADRDRRMAMTPQTITAFLCGDPLPGMSALDRR